MSPLACLPAHWLPGMAGRFLFSPGYYPTADEVIGTCWRCRHSGVKLSEHAELCDDCLEYLRHVSPV